jgi:maltose O-acetyltransferase
MSRSAVLMILRASTFAGWPAVRIGARVQILTPMHPFNAALRRRQEYVKPVHIGADVWVGGSALIPAGASIGSRAVIGTGSVVTRDVPENVLAAGNPCRVVREITD